MAVVYNTAAIFYEIEFTHEGKEAQSEDEKIIQNIRNLDNSTKIYLKYC